ncbi:MAG TPA: efflux RND transporter periplasmic adaptor subunit [Rhodanobacteraceae bacterium]|nr:efflux RND transporter periplasmic adaptor subunit [Rhodanobacteraceae bacterium]
MRRSHHAALAIIAAAAVAACSKPAPPPAPPVEVGVVIAHAGAFPLTRDLVGRLSATRTAEVRARVAGILIERVYTEGTDVKQGDVLFRIDPAPLEATLHAAQAALDQTRATAHNAAATAERYRTLADRRVVARQDLDNALATARSTAAAVSEARAKVESARLDLSYATVRAPIAGRAGRALVTEGALVGQGEATELTTIEQIDPIYVNFSESMADVERLRRGQAKGDLEPVASGAAKVRVLLPDKSPYPHVGTVSFADLAVDPATGAVSLRATVPNPERRLLPGMFVSLQLTEGERRNAFAIPQAAIQRDAAGAYVLSVDANGSVARKPVELGSMHGSDWIVTDGVAEGDRVIASGVQDAVVGARVRIVATGPGATARPAPVHAPSRPRDH